MPTIKRKVEMNLPQLIEWAWDNKIRSKTYRSLGGAEIEFSEGDVVRVYRTDSDDTFTVEVEEVVTEDTELYLVERYISSYEDFKLKYKSHQNRSIKSILENRSPHLKTTHFYTEVNNELVLIWKNGKLVE